MEYHTSHDAQMTIRLIACVGSSLIGSFLRLLISAFLEMLIFWFCVVVLFAVCDPFCSGR